MLTPTMGNSGDVVFRGTVEIYNRSSRANAIRDYHFRAKLGGAWTDMESELYQNTYRSFTEEDYEQFNVTPLTLAPYSGLEVHVQAIVKIQPFTKGYELPVRVEIEDLFGKRYRVEVKAGGR